MTAVLLGHVGNFEIQPDPYGLLVPLSRASGALCSHAGLEARGSSAWNSCMMLYGSHVESEVQASGSLLRKPLLKHIA